LNPENTRAHFNLGLLYSKMGDVDQADRALNRAWKLQPNNPRYLYTLVTVHRDHGQMEQALEYARTLKNEFPNNPRFQRVFRIMKRQAR
jgi:Flp pilus assembly protein TadD